MFELTGGLNYIVPIMVAVMISKWVGDFFTRDADYFYACMHEHVYVCMCVCLAFMCACVCACGYVCCVCPWFCCEPRIFYLLVRFYSCITA